MLLAALAPEQETPAALWLFDEGEGAIAHDATGNQNDGTVVGAEWTDGFIGFALHFRGGGQFADGDVVRVPHSASLDVTNAFSVQAWIMAHGSDHYLAIIDKYAVGPEQAGAGFTLYLTDGRLRFTLYSGENGSADCWGTDDLRQTGWHHVRASWDGAVMRVYVDESLHGETPWAFPPAANVQDLGIGKRIGGWGGFMPFEGFIDEVEMRWPESCTQYAVEWAPHLGNPMPWRSSTAVCFMTNGQWCARESCTNGNRFYRLRNAALRPQIQRIEPSVIAAECEMPMVLYLVGQHFNAGHQIRIGGTLLTETLFLGPSQLQVTLPPLAAGAYAVKVVDSMTGQTAVSVDLGLEVLAGGMAGLREPPASAPAEPSPCASCGAPPASPAPVHLFSGEFHHEEVDLRIPGRGLDFVWMRQYRSRLAQDTWQGNGWDFSYNLWVRWVETAVPAVELHDGNGGQWELYDPEGDGTFARTGQFREGHFDDQGWFILTFADQGTWQFHPLDAGPQAGRIGRIQDRNGNALAFAYDPAGRLTNITDTLNRPVQVTYNAQGWIAAVTDFSGRQARYAYYDEGEPGGAFGDLKSVTSPMVAGTPHGNDFPAGKTRRYTYSHGFADEALNHNLLTVTDAKGRIVLRNSYGTNQDSASLEFDRVLRQVQGGANEFLDFVYAPATPSPDNDFAVMKTIVNDRVGNVKEYRYDSRGRCLNRREFTGRAGKDQPTTETQNRPANPLRADDPMFFETRYGWNLDALLSRIVEPNGNLLEQIYEGDLNPAADRRARGNLRLKRHRPGPLGGDQSELVETFEYDTGLGGGGGFNFVTRHTDARGHTTHHGYDAHGNRTNTVHRIPRIVEDWEYNAFGQMTAHVWPDNGNGHRRRDGFTYYTGGAQEGYLQREVVDQGGLALTTAYEYDAVGNVVRQVDPRGNDTLFAVNALSQVVRQFAREVVPGSGARVETLTWYDANNNVARIDRENRGPDGALEANTHFTTLYEYDALDRQVRSAQEHGAVNLPFEVLAVSEIPASVIPDFVITEFAYDANGGQVLLRYPEAVAGNQPSQVVQTSYDERDLKFREIKAPGDAAQSTRQFDYDANGNLTRLQNGLEAEPQLEQCTYDGYNRRLTATDAMGNVTCWHYDANGNIVSERVDGELTDVPGSAANVRLAETLDTYDPMDRRSGTDTAFFDPQTQATLVDGWASSQTFYSDNSQVVGTVDDHGNVTTTSYDGAHRPLVVTDPKGNRTTRTYDANNNVVMTAEVCRSDLGNPDRVFVSRQVFDGWDRLVETVDQDALTNRFQYDSRNNRVAVWDGRGNLTHQTYDALNRLIQTTPVLTDTGNGTGAVIGEITNSQLWDASSRLIAQIDGNGNRTSYVYDALSRRIQVTFADLTTNTNRYDVHGNLVAARDANGTWITNRFDALNRLTHVILVPGPSVAPDSTFEDYHYDGRSRVVRAENDHSRVTRRHDSLDNLTGETQQVLPGGPECQVLSTYDAMGNELTGTYPGGRIITCTYDALHRKLVISESSGVIARYYYSGPVGVERRDLGNNTRLVWSYDALGRPSATRHTRVADGALIDERQYQWDGANNQTSVAAISTQSEAAKHFTYDSANRLVQSTDPASETVIEYDLDAVGNRLGITENGEPRPYVMEPALPEPADLQMNQYTVTPSGHREQDQNGNVIRAGSSEFAHDGRDRWVGAVVAGQITACRYDCFGRRIQKAVGPQVTRYYYAGTRVIEEQDSAGHTLTTWVWGVGLDELLETSRGGQRHFCHADDLGSIVGVTDLAANVVEGYRYDDYGNPTVYNAQGEQIAQSAIGNVVLFHGRPYDPETGFYYYRTRYLDPAAGRFASRDILGLWGDAKNGGNAYTYVGNNPWSAKDPFGLKWTWVTHSGSDGKLDWSSKTVKDYKVVDIHKTYYGKFYSEASISASWSVRHSTSRGESWISRYRVYAWADGEFYKPYINWIWVKWAKYTADRSFYVSFDCDHDSGTISRNTFNLDGDRSDGPLTVDIGYEGTVNNSGTDERSVSITVTAVMNVGGTVSTTSSVNAGIEVGASGGGASAKGSTSVSFSSTLTLSGGSERGRLVRGFTLKCKKH